MGAELKFVVECGDDRVYRDRIEHRTRNIEGFPEPTWDGVLRRRAEFPRIQTAILRLRSAGG
jgi:hypothetical protein